MSSTKKYDLCEFSIFARFRTLYKQFFQNYWLWSLLHNNLFDMRASLTSIHIFVEYSMNLYSCFVTLLNFAAY